MPSTTSSTSTWSSPSPMTRITGSVPDERTISELANTYMQTDGNIKAVLRKLFASEPFLGSDFAHYSWPIEFVVRAIKETGWNGFSVNAALTPLVNMGQTLYEPPDVAGWSLGPDWFSTSSMLSRMASHVPMAPAASVVIRINAFTAASRTRMERAFIRLPSRCIRSPTPCGSAETRGPRQPWHAAGE